MTSVSSSSPRCLQVLDQAPAGLIHVAALVGQPAGDVEVRVPVVVVDLHEPHAPLDQPPGQQRRVRERARLLRRLAVERVGRRGLAADVGQLGDAGLHAEGQLVLLDPRVRLGVAHELVIHLVERLEPVERVAASPAAARPAGC